MDAQETSINVVRIINAPPHEVFDAWTDPQLLGRWLAPDTYSVRSVDVDACAGGHYRIEMAGPDSQPLVITGEYREVASPYRLVQTWVYEDSEQDGEQAETLLTVELREIEPEVTELTLTHALIPKAQYQEMALKDWIACLDNLEVFYFFKREETALAFAAW